MPTVEKDWGGAVVLSPTGANVVASYRIVGARLTLGVSVVLCGIAASGTTEVFWNVLVVPSLRAVLLSGVVVVTTVTVLPVVCAVFGVAV